MQKETLIKLEKKTEIIWVRKVYFPENISEGIGIVLKMV